MSDTTNNIRPEPAEEIEDEGCPYSEDGDHRWRFLGENRDGDRFYECALCGAESN